MKWHVTVIGGTGFIGRRLVERLVSRGARVRVVSRKAPARSSAPVEWIAGDVEDASLPGRAVEGAAAVVYLIGTTSARTREKFYSLHCEAPARFASAASRAGARRFLYVSAMGVAPDAPALADRSKAAGEHAVRDAFADANIVRPALVYGPGDHFFSQFTALARSAPAIPLIGGGHTRFQPIHVDDAAEAMARILENEETAGRAYDLGAAETFTLRELIEQACDAAGRRPLLLPVPFAVAQAGAWATERLPGAPLTLDQVLLLKTDKVVRDSGPSALGVHPQLLENFLSELARQQR